MGTQFEMDDLAYSQMLGKLGSLYFTDKPGNAQDCAFIYDDTWLSDTAVIDQLRYYKRMWEIRLVFAHFQDPMRFLARRISAHSCPKRAAMMAGYMRRLAAKDQRGTLRVNLADLSIELN